jgi:hypothetical protein
MEKCKNCKCFDNKRPVSTSTRNDAYKNAEKYIGYCKNTNRPTMMNDGCLYFEPKEKSNEQIK